MKIKNKNYSLNSTLKNVIHVLQSLNKILSLCSFDISNFSLALFDNSYFANVLSKSESDILKFILRVHIILRFDILRPHCVNIDQWLIQEFLTL